LRFPRSDSATIPRSRTAPSELWPSESVRCATYRSSLVRVVAQRTRAGAQTSKMGEVGVSV